MLLTYEEYERLLNAPSNLADHLEMDEDIDFDIEPTGLDLRPASL